MSNVTLRQTQGDAEHSRSIKSQKSRLPKPETGGQAKVGEIDIDYVAKLANLPLTPKERSTFSKQLQEVLGYISKLQEADTKNIDPIGHITGLANITKDDATISSISQEEALANAPKTYNGFFEVEAIFEEV